MRHQPTSDLTTWYRARFADNGVRGRKVGVVAMARKLAIVNLPQPWTTQGWKKFSFIGRPPAGVAG